MCVYVIQNERNNGFGQFQKERQYFFGLISGTGANCGCGRCGAGCGCCNPGNYSVNPFNVLRN